MKAEIVNLEDGERVIVSKIHPPIAPNRDFCLEIHRGQKSGFSNMHVLMTRDELHELGEAVRALLEDGRDPRRGP